MFINIKQNKTLIKTKICSSIFFVTEKKNRENTIFKN